MSYVLFISMKQEHVKSSKPREVLFPTGGIYALESHHREDFSMDVLQHDFLKILYVLEGRGRLWVGDSYHELRANQPVFVPAGLAHKMIDETPLSLFALCIRKDALAFEIFEACQKLPLQVMPLTHQSKSWSEAFRAVLYEQTMARDVSPFKIHAKVLWMLQEFFCYKSFSQKESSHDRIRRYIGELEETFFEEVSLAEAARQTRLGERQFSTLFREATGQSWLQYLRMLRLSYAQTLLLSTSRTITAIVFECGFSDLSNFYRAFRSQYGCSPQEYRKRHEVNSDD